MSFCNCYFYLGCYALAHTNFFAMKMSFISSHVVIGKGRDKWIWKFARNKQLNWCVQNEDFIVPPWFWKKWVLIKDLKVSISKRDTSGLLHIHCWVVSHVLLRDTAWISLYPRYFYSLYISVSVLRCGKMWKEEQLNSELSCFKTK